MTDPDLITLRIRRTPSGQYVGRLFVGDEEVGEIAERQTPEAIAEAARETGLDPDRIEFEDD